MSNIVASDDYIDDSLTFESFNLDQRLIQAINKLGFKNPTLIQSKSIQLSLDEKRDIIAKASTGSGKTAAYCIPIIQSLLSDLNDSVSNSNNSNKFIKSLILVPTKELANQVYEFLNQLTIYCGKYVKILNLSSSNNVSENIQINLLLENPEIQENKSIKFEIFGY
ncbi:unnamed protein product [[Candida] boidinii]|uniref:RNA helicase n=1 Tax=Candida boidinii TaxID=5477 RepID=A0A9W6WH74_CANBO|nr:unnamed protein product [[Candida] boidinii]